MSARELTSVAQRWGLVRLIDGSWKIENRSSGECLATGSSNPVVLDGVGLDANPGQPLVSEVAAHSSPGQSWDVQTAGRGYYFIVNKATGLVLSLDGAGRAIEAPLTFAGSQGQWAITPVAISRGK